MLKRYRVVILVTALICFAAIGVWAAAAKIMSVQMKVSELRSSPSGLSSVVATVKMGDRMTVLEEKGAWTKVSTESGVIGWIPSSSLIKGTVKVNAGGADAKVAASSDEMSLATKGFTSQVESDFKKQHKDIDFTWVDKMNEMKITTEEMKDFLEAGDVQVGKGGAQ
ncbi:MAG: SH3 domain-containing protein [Thermodesulfobacteriota bacterium]